MPTPCSPGTKQDATGAALCDECPAGSFQGSYSATACRTCTPGYYCGQGASAALPCPGGRYENATLALLGLAMTSADECIECPVGSYCPSGAAEASPCNAGTVAPNVGTERCAQCGVGTFQGLAGKTACERCAVAHFCPSVGATSPVPCPAGTWSSATGLEAEAQCTKVVKGEWAPTGSSAPEQCPASGFYCPGYDADAARLQAEGDNATVPGSKPVLIDNAAFRTTVNVTVVSFELDVDLALADYDEETLRSELAAYYGVPRSTISLSVGGSATGRRQLQSGSLVVAVTITPEDASDAAVQALSDSVAAQNADAAALASQLSQVSVVTASAPALESVEVEQPADCALGYWCSAGKAAPCPEATYADPTLSPSERDTLGSCLACPEESTSPPATTSVGGCLCREGYYDSAPAPDDVVCLPYFSGINASDVEVGTTLATLPVERGYWRPSSNSTQVQFCRPDGNSEDSACVGGRATGDAGGPCRANTTGPYCSQCVDGLPTPHFYEDSECKPCEEGNDQLAALLIGLCAVAVFVLVAITIRHEVKRRKRAHRASSASAGGGGGGGGEATSSTNDAEATAAAARAASSKSGSSEEEEAAEGDAVEEAFEEAAEELEQKLGGGRSKLVRRVIAAVKGAKVKVKICVSFFQVATKLESVYGVVFPQSTGSVLEVFSVVNLDIFSAFPLPWACLNIGTYRNKLLAIAGAPAALVTLIMLAGAASSFRCGGGDDDDSGKGSSTGGGSSAADGDAAAGDAADGSETRKMRRRSSMKLTRKEGTSLLRTLPFALRLSFLVFPAVSSLAFQGFNCVEVNAATGQAFLAQDLSVECEYFSGIQMPADASTRLTMYLTIVVYTLGVPLVYVALLVSARAALLTGARTPLSSALSFMADDFEPVFFWYEIIIVLEKLFLTSVMIVVRRGTLVQVVVGLCVKLTTSTVQNIASPYLRASDDLFASAANAAMIAFFIFVLLLQLHFFTDQLPDNILSQEMEQMVQMDVVAVGGGTLVAVLLALVLLGLLALLQMWAVKTAVTAERQQGLITSSQQLAVLKEVSPENDGYGGKVLFEPSMLPKGLGEHLIGPAIGSGAFGTVYRGTHHGLACAVKRLDKANFGDAEAVKAFRENAELMLAVHHPSCLGVLGVTWRLHEDHADVCVLMELGISLQKILETPSLSGAMAWGRQKLALALALVRGVAHLHSLGTQHANLKPQNVILLDAGVGSNAKLADASATDAAVARSMRDDGAPNANGSSCALDSQLYMAPEMLRLELFGPKNDVWALGCLLEVLWTHLPVHTRRGRSQQEAVAQVKAGALAPSVPAHAFIRQAVARCASREPARRPTAEELDRMLSEPDMMVEAGMVPPGPPAAFSPEERGVLSSRQSTRREVLAGGRSTRSAALPKHAALPKPQATGFKASEVAETYSHPKARVSGGSHGSHGSGSVGHGVHGGTHHATHTTKRSAYLMDEVDEKQLDRGSRLELRKAELHEADDEAERHGTKDSPHREFYHKGSEGRPSAGAAKPHGGGGGGGGGAAGPMLASRELTRGALHAAGHADDELAALEAEAARLRAEIAADVQAAATPAFVSHLHEGEHTTKHQEVAPDSMLHC